MKHRSSESPDCSIIENPCKPVVLSLVQGLCTKQMIVSVYS